MGSTILAVLAQLFNLENAATEPWLHAANVSDSSCKLQFFFSRALMGVWCLRSAAGGLLVQEVSQSRRLHLLHEGQLKKPISRLILEEERLCSPTREASGLSCWNGQRKAEPASAQVQPRASPRPLGKFQPSRGAPNPSRRELREWVIEPVWWSTTSVLGASVGLTPHGTGCPVERKSLQSHGVV